ncbi:MAG TPA: DNA polymerase I, partial [Candidatus Competibacteraceae bacterium]|nr:DNA polymerase I [Candidatus Competibacteraceae bacterium]
MLGECGCTGKRGVITLTTTTKLLLLVDGSSYLYRAYHALPPLSTSTGEPTGALYGVIAMLRKLLETYRPAYLAVIFDAPGKNFRHEMFADYKAHRPPIPEELLSQAEPLYATIRAMGLPLLQVPSVEADDVIATLAKQASAQGMRVIIATGDKDMAQLLVDGNITLLDTLKNTVTDAAGVQEKFGVPPERMVDYLALVGDTSDNVPGVAGVGPKTAARWLQQYGSLDEIIAKADSIPGSLGEKLKAGLEQLPLSRRLVTLDCAVELPLQLEQLQPSPPDRQALRELFSRYEFKSWLRQLDDTPPPTVSPKIEQTPPQGDLDYRLILDESALDVWLERLRQADLFAFDTETNSLDYIEAQIVGVSFAIQPLEAAYVPLAHDYPGAPVQLNRERVLEKLRPLLEDPQRPKLGQNLKYDLHVLGNHGIHLAGIRHDTMLESYVLDSTARHDMDGMAENYLDTRTIHYEDVAGRGAKQLAFNQVPLEQAGPYAAEDADVTLRLHRHLWPQLSAESALRQVYEAIEVPLIPVLARMERNGVQIDAGLLREQSREIEKRLLELEREAHAMAGEAFNLGSTKQLQYILFDKLRLPANKKTPKGQPSTAEDVLQELALDYSLPKLILEHRGLSKLKSTYTDRLPQEINPHTGRVHTSYHQAVASTGRLSSTDPNLQQIPARTLEGRRIRQAFIAPSGYRIMAADYSQIELRIMAHLSGDEGLLRAFAAG